MTKLQYFSVVTVISLMVVSNAAMAGEAKRISKKLPVSSSTSADVNAFKLKLVEAERSSKIISEYRSKEKVIVSEFRKLRSNKLSKLRAVEIIQCKVYAKKPRPTKGRRSDSCSISNDSSYFKGWDVVSANDKRMDNYNGGQPKGSSVNKNNRVTLSLTCRSPKWRDTTSGRCQLTKRTTIMYKPSSKLISEIINQEVGVLLTR